MDQRLHDRLAIALPAKVVDFTDGRDLYDGHIVDVSPAGICVVMETELARGALVRVDFPEGSIFGNVAHVTQSGAAFRTGIEVFDVVLGRSDLARLIEETLGKTADRPLRIRAAPDWPTAIEL